MPDKAFTKSPEKGGLKNIESGEQFIFQFNPPEVVESISVNYARHQVPGLGHQILHYINTNNNQIALEVYFSKIAESPTDPSGDPPGIDPNPYDVMNAKRFLQSCLYPLKSQSGGWLAPPTLIFSWPNVIRIGCVAISAVFNHQRFSLESGETIALMCELTLEEVSLPVADGLPMFERLAQPPINQRFSDFVRRQGSLVMPAGSFGSR